MHGKAITLFRRIRTFLLVTSFLIFFRTNSFSEAITIIKTIVTDIHIPTIDSFSSWGINIVNMTILIFSIILLSITPRFFKLIQKINISKIKILEWGMCLMLCLLIISLGTTETNQFIYFKF